MFELKNVNKFYKAQTVTIGLKNINLKLYKNEIVAIVGPSGAGKSTLLNVICGLDSYDDGEIYFKGNETSYFNDIDRDIFRKKNVAIISQNFNLINSYTVLNNVMIPLLINGLPYKEARKKAMEYIEKVGLISHYKSHITELSGGEKQRCVIARALATECEVLACDEPTGNLDSETGKQIINLIKEVSKDKLVLIVTHNYAEVENIVTRTINIKDGEIVSDIQKNNIKDDEVKDLDLRNELINKKNLYHLMFQNIKGTPKKTFFVSLVYLIVSALLLFLVLSCLSVKDESKYTNNYAYFNTINNRIIVFDADHKPIDPNKLNKIKGPKFINAFYEDITIDLYVGLGNSMKSLNGTFGYYLPNDFVLVEGEYPTSDEDIMIVFSYDEFQENIDNYIGTTDDRIVIAYNGLNKTSYRLCGFGYSRQTIKTQFYAHKDLSTNLSVLYFTNVKATLDINGKNVPFSFSRSIGDQKPKIIYYSNNENDKVGDVTITFNDIYSLTIANEDMDVTVNYNKEYSGQPYISASLYLPLLLNDVYEMTIYANDIDSALKEINRAGYIAVTPGRSGVNPTSDTYIRYLLLVLVTIVSFVIVTFIGYFIISRIFISKNKEYAILRSLGLIGKDLTSMIIKSSIFIAVFISTFTFILFIIGMLVKISIFNVMNYINIYIVLAFYLYSIIIGAIIGLKTSKRIQKMNLSSVLKSEV